MQIILTYRHYNITYFIEREKKRHLIVCTLQCLWHNKPFKTLCDSLKKNYGRYKSNYDVIYHSLSCHPSVKIVNFFLVLQLWNSGVPCTPACHILYGFFILHKQLVKSSSQSLIIDYSGTKKSLSHSKTCGVSARTYLRHKKGHRCTQNHSK